MTDDTRHNVLVYAAVRLRLERGIDRFWTTWYILCWVPVAKSLSSIRLHDGCDMDYVNVLFNDIIESLNNLGITRTSSCNCHRPIGILSKSLRNFQLSIFFRCTLFERLNYASVYLQSKTNRNVETKFHDFFAASK